VVALAIDSDSAIYASTWYGIYKKTKAASVFEPFIDKTTGSMMLDGDDLYAAKSGSLRKYNKNTGDFISEVLVDDAYVISGLVKSGTDFFVNISYRDLVRINSNGDLTDFSPENHMVGSFAITSGTIYLLSNGKFYKSGTDTPNWQEITNTDTDLTKGYIVSTNGNTIIVSCSNKYDEAGTNATNGSVISHDNGATWEHMEIFNFMTQIVYSDGVYYGSGYNYTFVSKDNGATWLSKPIAPFWTQAILPTKDSVYVGTVGNSVLSYKKLKLQNIVFDAIPDKTMGDAPFDVNATSTEDLTVTVAPYSWYLDKVSVSGKTVTLKAPGRVFLYALQPGNAKVDQASQVDRSFCINPEKPTIATSNVTATSVTLTSSSDLANEWYLDGEKIEGVQTKTYQATPDGDYTVLTFVDNCKSAESDVLTFPIPPEPPVTGLKESLDSQIAIYPNPAAHEIVVQVPSESSIQLIDMLGISIENRTSNASGTELFNVRSLSKGVYLFRINTNGQLTVKRFLKQ